jgi:alanine dehydrogenase
MLTTGTAHALTIFEGFCYTGCMAIILSENDLKALYRDPAAMDGLLDAIEATLRAHDCGEVVGQVRVATTLVDTRRKYRIMTAALPAAGFGMRISALFSSAKDAYFHLVFDNDTGELLGVVAGRELNTWRTGAPCGVAARYLAPANANALGFLGSGRQARGQLLAICRALPSLRHVRVFSPTAAHRTAFAQEMSTWLGIDIQAVDSPHAAVQNAPVVGVATDSRSPVLKADWISTGALVVSITGGQLPAELIKRSRVIVSWKEEVLAGEAPRQPYASMIDTGIWSGDDIAGELGAVIAGKILGRQNLQETIVFECVGMPVLDTAAAAWAYRWAKGRRIGASFNLD